jgi:hypothetical protein
VVARVGDSAGYDVLQNPWHLKSSPVPRHPDT